MKNPIKAIRRLLLFTILLVVLAVVALSVFADKAVKVAVEKGAAGALKVGVTVRRVNLALLRGRIGFKDLVIDNPPGYQHDRLLRLGQADIEVEARSLLRDEVRIREITLHGMNLVLEQKGLSNNLQEVINSLPKGGGEPSGKTLRIDHLKLTDVTVAVKLLPVPGKADTLTLRLAPIETRDLGSDSKLDVATLSAKILMAVAGGIAEQGASVLPEDIVGPLSSTLEVGRTIVEGAEKIGQILPEAQGLGKKISEGLGGLLKSKEDP